MSELAKLRWQCRRGTRELDLLLTRYLENRYGQATDQEKALFSELLSFEDDVLLDVLLGGIVKPPLHMESLIYCISHS
ncbi:succinate dehydrogenase assembly factor 2 [Crenothrix sp.]|uniref:FAD assembly factor SdhE n=1 Tax=Crenothrix sp. TaxID=3100433 RepID=UPI00374CF168